MFSSLKGNSMLNSSQVKSLLLRNGRQWRRYVYHGFNNGLISSETEWLILPYGGHVCADADAMFWAFIGSSSRMPLCLFGFLERICTGSCISHIWPHSPKNDSFTVLCPHKLPGCLSGRSQEVPRVSEAFLYSSLLLWFKRLSVTPQEADGSVLLGKAHWKEAGEQFGTPLVSAVCSPCIVRSNDILALTTSAGWSRELSLSVRELGRSEEPGGKVTQVVLLITPCSPPGLAWRLIDLQSQL